MYYVIKKAKFNCRKKSSLVTINAIKKKFGIYPKTIEVIETVHNELSIY